MSAIASLSAYDGTQPTPVLHTLLAVSVTREGGKITALWRESLAGVPIYAQVWCQMTLERLKSGVYRTECRTVVPVQEVVTGSNTAGYSAAPKVAYENTVVTTGFFSERSDVAGRRLVRQLACNIDAGLVGTQAVILTGPLPELFDLLNAPT